MKTINEKYKCLITLLEGDERVDYNVPIHYILAIKGIQVLQSIHAELKRGNDLRKNVRWD